MPYATNAVKTNEISIDTPRDTAGDIRDNTIGDIPGVTRGVILGHIHVNACGKMPGGIPTGSDVLDNNRYLVAYLVALLVAYLVITVTRVQVSQTGACFIIRFAKPSRRVFAETHRNKTCNCRNGRNCRITRHSPHLRAAHS